MPPRKINLVEAADAQILDVFQPYIAGDVDSERTVTKLERLV